MPTMASPRRFGRASSRQAPREHGPNWAIGIGARQKVYPVTWLSSALSLGAAAGRARILWRTDVGISTEVFV